MNFAPPPGAYSSVAAQRRHHDMQPPPLSTSVADLQRRGPSLAAPTPLTAVSMSSPFTGYHQPFTPGGAQAYASPTPRSTIQSVPYNPQQWSAPSNTPTPAVPYVPHGSFTTGSARPVSPSDVAPPPPYSPRRPHPDQQTPSPQNQPEPSPQGAPSQPDPSGFNTTGRGAPPFATQSSYLQSPVPMNSPSPQPNTSTPSQDATYAFPPPPNSSGRRARSGSRSRTQPIFSLSNLTSRSRNQPITQANFGAVPPTEPGPSNTSGSRGFASSNFVNDGAEQARPPAARRAASTGTIGFGGAPAARARPDDGQLASAARWAPGMPLPPPPPPPGPPPAGSRSQSLNRTAEVSRNYSMPTATAPPTRRPPTTGRNQSSLPPVPPTPADWVDEEPQPQVGSSSNQREGLQLDVEAAINNSSPRNRDEFPATAAPTVGYDRDAMLVEQGLGDGRMARSKTRHDKGIRERRNESRSGKGRAVEPQATISVTNNPWPSDAEVKPADLVLPSPTGLARRPAITKSTPRSARSITSPDAPIGSAKSVLTVDSAATYTPRPGSAHSHTNGENSIPTPRSAGVVTNGTTGLANRGLSGTSPRPFNDGRSASSLAVRPPSEKPSPRISNTSAKRDNGRDDFMDAAILRHNAFAEREAAAKSDKQRVQIFADFIVNESRMRRERYAGAIDAMGSEILELTRDLFRPYNSARRSEVATPSSGSGGSDWPPPSPNSHRGSLNAAARQSAGTSSRPKPEGDSPSSAGSGASSSQGHDAPWIGGYMPSLSPIPSMDVSEAPDELSSRGRPPSRWWEASNDGSVYGGGVGRGLERSKRESKYMGLPRELRESMQWDGSGTPTASIGGTSNNSNAYGPNEYPPEKTGWHERLPPPPPHNPYSPAPFTPVTPDPRKLDVSRLVTLPPPYPRHYPAVNNNHPDLTSIRAVVRAVSDFTEITAIKEKYIASIDEAREKAEDNSQKRRSFIRKDIQRQIEAGTMSYTEAGKLESNEEAEENEKKKARNQAEFNQLQTEVVKPVHSVLTERIDRATQCIEELRSNLFVDAQESNPNSTQEQGDEQPELLEKLTLLKWLFEAREQLHKEVYDLLGDRNDRYKAMVVQPYRLLGNEEKAREAEEFFQKDHQDQKIAYEKGTLRRTEEFMEIIEENVVRGVEIQLSAFWDIAPGLLKILHRIPNDLDGFEIQIPADEYEENPSYHEHPMQYLHSLLDHSERSTYQFIEAQTNLLCLLHEVKSGVTAANCRLMETQRYLAGEDFAVVDSEMRDVRRDEERRLTDDLKEKVRTVEDQWKEALGEELLDVKERVADWLVSHGGWEDEEE